MQEMREFSQDESPDLMAEALEDNIFEWHFIVRGAADSEFEGGLYHGRILLPPEYPFKPPSFLLLTPNGRFETGQKVCLSISSHHPEHWQPSWSVRTALVALVAFMQTPGGGAIAALDYSKEERRELARLSREKPPQFGSPARQALTDAAHATMLRREQAAQAAKAAMASTAEAAPCGSGGISPVALQASLAEAAQLPSDAPITVPAGATAAGMTVAQNAQPAAQSLQPAVQSSPVHGSGAVEAAASSPAAEGGHPFPSSLDPAASLVAGARDTVAQQGAVSSHPQSSAFAVAPGASDAAAVPVAARLPPHMEVAGSSNLAARPADPAERAAASPSAVGVQSWEETGLTALAVAIVVAILALLVKRVAVVTGGAGYEAGSPLM